MENIDFLLRATKLIVESCTLAKHQFRKIVLAYFEQHKELNKVVLRLPKKRKSRELVGNGKKAGKGNLKKRKKVEARTSSSGSDSGIDGEMEYDGRYQGDLKMAKDRFEQVLNEELMDVFASDGWSLFESDSENLIQDFCVQDLELIYSKLLKFSPDLYDNLLQLDNYLENFKRVKQEDLFISKILLQKILKIDFNRQEDQFKTLNSKIQSSISAILKGFQHDTDWKSFLSSIEKAAKDLKEQEIYNIIRTIFYIFPDNLNEDNISEIKPLIKQVKIVSKVCKHGQTKTLASEIISKWNRVLSESGYEKQVTFYKILGSINLEDSDNGEGFISSNSNILRANNSKRK